MATMVRTTWVNRLAIASSVWALAATAPLRAEDAAVPPPSALAAADAQSPATSAPAAEQLAPGETPVPLAVAPPPPAATPVPVVATPAVPVTDPNLLAVRDRLAKPLPGVDKADQSAMTAFYATRTDGLVWIKSGAFTPSASAVLAALRAADDWGLSSKDFVLPDLAPGASADAEAAAEVAITVAALKYAHQASGGRVDPATLSRFNDDRGTFADPSVTLAQLAASDRANEILEGLHPRNPQFVRLHEALLKLRHGPAPKDEPAAPEAPHMALDSGPTLKPGVSHPDVALIRAFLATPGEPGREAVYDPALVRAVKAFQEAHGLKANGIVSGATRTALNGGDAKPKPRAAADPARDIERIALNMERWRWLPADLGAFHIENNIPEFQTRVFKDGKVVHEEKIIVGKTDTPTPIFSANMLFVIFHPEWGVPDGIKVKEIWPYLRRKPADDFFGLSGEVSDTSVLRRHNLRVSYNGRPVDASQIDWTRADPRAYQFIQPAGGENVLGVVKFRFPNRHDVYMHDTPQRDLFNQSTRALSHGCMRVHNPERLAEVILAEDRGWSADKVEGMIAGSVTNEVKLDKPFPVHVVYFTARVDDDGKLRTFDDIYGHDAKLVSALAGNAVRLEDPAASGSESFVEGGSKSRRIARGGPQPKPEPSLGNLLTGLFGN